MRTAQPGDRVRVHYVKRLEDGSVVSSHGREPLELTVGVCRGLRSQLGRALTPLLVLVPPAREALVRAALEARANSCLSLPVHPKELVAMVARARGGNRPGRQTLNLDRAQHEDRWRDDGGQG
jgi:DNA-binding response OmpR family regulator